MESLMTEILSIYHRLQEHYRIAGWWPADAPFEVAVGAFLTQNTNWNNVEKALANLRGARALDSAVLAAMPRRDLEPLIRPAGFFRQKSERLQLFCQHLLQHHGGCMERLLRQDLDVARAELLSLHGIGQETADSILLYGGEHLSFVVDSYTRRLFARLGLLTGNESYDRIRAMFMAAVPAELDLYRGYHGLIVNHCKERCRKTPLCRGCPCAEICRYAA